MQSLRATADGTAGGERGKAAAELEKQRERRGNRNGRQTIDNQFKYETFGSGEARQAGRQAQAVRRYKPTTTSLPLRRLEREASDGEDVAAGVCVPDQHGRRVGGVSAHGRHPWRRPRQLHRLHPSQRPKPGEDDFKKLFPGKE